MQIGSSCGRLQVREHDLLKRLQSILRRHLADAASPRRLAALAPSQHLALVPDAKLPAAALTLKGSAHQGLCDLATTLPHWLGQALQLTVMRTSKGLSAAAMARWHTVIGIQFRGLCPPWLCTAAAHAVPVLQGIPGTVQPYSS